MKTQELIRWDIRAAVMDAFKVLHGQPVWVHAAANSAPVLLMPACGTRHVRETQGLRRRMGAL